MSVYFYHTILMLKLKYAINPRYHNHCRQFLFDTPQVYFGNENYFKICYNSKKKRKKCWNLKINYATTFWHTADKMFLAGRAASNVAAINADFAGTFLN